VPRDRRPAAEPLAADRVGVHGGAERRRDGRRRGDHQRERAERVVAVPGLPGRRLDPLELRLGSAADMRLGVVAGAVAALVAAAGATSSAPLGPTTPGTSISFVLRLRLDSARLDRDLAAGRRVASAAALGRRYGLPLASVRRVEQVLRTHGIAVVGDYP